MHRWSCFSRATLTCLRASMVIASSLALATLAAIWRSPDPSRLPSGPQLFGGYPALLFGLAMLLAGAAYLRGLQAKPEPLTRRHLLAAIAIQLSAAPAPPFTSTDAFMNLAYGRLAVLGHDPYATPPRLLPEADPYRARLDWPESRNAWGPIALLPAAFAARQATQSGALLVFKLAMLGAVLLSLLAAFRYCRSLPLAEGGAAFFFYGSNPLLAWELSGQAHNDALLVLCCVAFLWRAYAHKHAAALALLCVGFLAKYASAPVLGLYWLLQWRDSRRRLAAATTVVGAGLASLVWYFDAFDSMRGLSIVATTPRGWVVNSLASFAALAESLTGVPLLRPWSVAGLLLAAAAAARYALRPATLERVMTDSLSFTLLFHVLVMGRYWPWYATWLLPLALARDNRHQRSTVAVFCSLAPALYLTGAAGGLAILVVHGTGLTLWWRAAHARSCDP